MLQHATPCKIHALLSRTHSESDTKAPTQYVCFSKGNLVQAVTSKIACLHCSIFPKLFNFLAQLT